MNIVFSLHLIAKFTLLHCKGFIVFIVLIAKNPLYSNIIYYFITLATVVN